MQEIGFVGLGNMGMPMARNLAAAGYKLSVFNRSREKAERLAAETGVTVVSRPSDLGKPGGVVISMLADDAALEQVVKGPEGLSEGPAGIVHVSMSTVSPEISRRIGEIHTGRGDRYVSAPVFGRPEAAASRKLWICQSGDPSAAGQIRPILETLGQGIFDFGADPGAANIVKLAANFVIGAAIESMAEALALVEKNGIDRVRVMEMLSSTLFDCPIYKNYGSRIAAQKYDEVGFALPLGLKDIQLVQAASVAARVPMPFAAIVRDRLLATLAKGRGQLDWTAFALGVSDDAGLTH